MDFVEFRDGDRTFTCHAESSPATPGTVWWWVSVTGETQRYAAFRVEKAIRRRTFAREFSPTMRSCLLIANVHASSASTGLIAGRSSKATVSLRRQIAAGPAAR